MNKLLITAHPNPHGFTHKIAKEFTQHAQKNHDVKTIDLYDQERKQDFLMLNEKNRPVDDPLRSRMQELITRADELVFIFPVWWFDAPAILKNWFDVNMTQGFAFVYKGSPIPEKLLKGKTSRIFLTTGAPTRVSYSLGLCYWMSWVRGRLSFVGIKNKSYTVFGNMNKLRYHDDRAKMLAKVASLAKKS